MLNYFIFKTFNTNILFFNTSTFNQIYAFYAGVKRRAPLLVIAIHGFIISVPVLISSVFWQLLLRNGKISSKFRVNICFETREQSVQTVDGYSKVISQAL